MNTLLIESNRNIADSIQEIDNTLPDVDGSLKTSSVAKWNTIVSDFNQDFDKFKARWRGQGVKMELKTKDLDGILKRGRSTRQTHWDIR